jgi:D-alanyl-D-alanine endopeptidase (penicillin-binding protein 7)
MLVNSDNAAAESLAADYPGGRAAFIGAMNRLAASWNLFSIKFEDPTGLGAGNVGTARDIAELLLASAGYWLIREISVQKQVAIESKIGQRVRTINLNNTNTPILFEFENIVVSKTGLTSRAGFCLGLVVEQNNRQYVAVFLGHPTKVQRAETVKSMLYNYLNDANLADLPTQP